MEKKFSLHERLAMKQTLQMEIGNTYTINKIASIIDFVDTKTNEPRKAVVVECTDGNLYYLPNTIANAYLSALNEVDNPFEVNKELEGNTFKCVEFLAKRFNTKGKTLQLV